MKFIGFRSNKMWKKIVACIGYVLIVFIFLASLREATIGDTVILNIQYLSLGLPIIIALTNIDFLKKKISLLNSEKISLRVLGRVICSVGVIFISINIFLITIAITDDLYSEEKNIKLEKIRAEDLARNEAIEKDAIAKQKQDELEKKEFEEKKKEEEKKRLEDELKKQEKSDKVEKDNLNNKESSNQVVIVSQKLENATVFIDDKYYPAESRAMKIAPGKYKVAEIISPYDFNAFLVTNGKWNKDIEDIYGYNFNYYKSSGEQFVIDGGIVEMTNIIEIKEDEYIVIDQSDVEFRLIPIK